MSDGGALINLGDITKPATVLIEKISDAIGGIARPGHTRRMARAEADAEIIRAETRLKITELEERALERMLREEAKKQENIEKITYNATEKLNAESRPEEIPADWISYFFEKCRVVSDSEMQSMWASILAGEANSPGAFSRKTIDIVASFDRSDALLFTKFVKFVWMSNDPFALIFDINHPVYGREGVRFGELMHLESLGLIQFNHLSGFMRTNIPKYFNVFYYGCPLTIEFPADMNNMELGQVLITSFGKQLLSVCHASPSADFRDYVISKWISKGMVLSTPVVGKESCSVIK